MRPLRDLLGEEEVFFAFSDYKERGRYFTSTLYLTTLGHWQALARRLGEIRSQHRVPFRWLDYKSRQKWDKQRPAAMEAWLEAQREAPGIAICVAVSKRLREQQRFRAFLDQVPQSPPGACGSVTGAARASALWKLSPFFVAAPLLKQGALAWYSDRDALQRGALGQELFPTLMHYLELGGAKATLVYPEYPETSPLPDAVERVLSLPDLVSGVVADWLPSPFVPAALDRSTLDREAFKVLASLALMGAPSQQEGSPGRLQVCVVGHAESGWTFEELAFSANRK